MGYPIIKKGYFWFTRSVVCLVGGGIGVILKVIPHHPTPPKQTPLTELTQITLYIFIFNTHFKNLQWGIRMCGCKATLLLSLPK